MASRHVSAVLCLLQDYQRLSCCSTWTVAPSSALKNWFKFKKPIKLNGKPKRLAINGVEVIEDFRIGNPVIVVDGRTREQGDHVAEDPLEIVERRGFDVLSPLSETTDELGLNMMEEVTSLLGTCLLDDPMN